jgi:hypothetical protein
LDKYEPFIHLETFPHDWTFKFTVWLNRHELPIEINCAGGVNCGDKDSFLFLENNLSKLRDTALTDFHARLRVRTSHAKRLRTLGKYGSLQRCNLIYMGRSLTISPRNCGLSRIESRSTRRMTGCCGSRLTRYSAISFMWPTPASMQLY